LFIQDFETAMVKRFTSINTKTSDKPLKGSDLTNELDIITAPEEIYQLWSRFIIAHGMGELIDPDTCLPFNKGFDWATKSKNFLLNREFFKSMGGLENEDLKKLAVHLLNETPGRELEYPKVSVKRPKINFWECMSSKMWVEKRKRKKCVAREFHNIQPTLGLFDSDDNFVADNWKIFKVDYNINRQTKAMLFSVPGDTFFTDYRQKKTKNKSVEEISEYAAEFFKKFLDVKGNFEMPTPVLHHRMFDASNFRFGPWEEGYTWAEGRCAVGLIDLRRVPGYTSRVDDTSNIYFNDFLNAWSEFVTDPSIRTPDVWLWITETSNRSAQAHVYFEKLKDDYKSKSSAYNPASNERFNGIQENKVLEKHLIPLLFLVKKSSRAFSLIGDIPATFNAPDLPLYKTAGAYLEHDLCLEDHELRLEFYIRVLRMFSVPGDRFLSIFAGTKPMLAGIVSHFILSSLISRFDVK